MCEQTFSGHTVTNASILSSGSKTKIKFSWIFDSLNMIDIIKITTSPGDVTNVTALTKSLILRCRLGNEQQAVLLF